MKANSLKQRGFYTDYMEDRWHSPREISAFEFSQGLAIVERFVDITALQSAKLSS